jgi:hypothetical protein
MNRLFLTLNQAGTYPVLLKEKSVRRKNTAETILAKHLSLLGNKNFNNGMFITLSTVAEIRLLFL